MKIVITGANSSVGKNLLALLADQPDMEVIAGARSEKALADLPGAAHIHPATIDYLDRDGLQQTLAGADVVVHLAGILIENRRSNYATANVAATAAVADAARAGGVGHLVFVSVVGAGPDSKNAYFRSKGTAEQLCLNAGLRATVLRTPLLLGAGTAGAASLVNTARREQAKILGGGDYVMRPLDVDDLSRALLALCRTPAEDGNNTYELVGPEGLSYRDLITKTAQKLGHEIEIEAIPVWAAKVGAAVTSILKGGGITPTVIDVITRDEKVGENAAERLGIALTPLDTTLDKIIKDQTRS